MSPAWLRRAWRPDLGLAVTFVAQIGVGAATGLLCGWFGAFAVNRIRLDAAGLYPLFAGGFALLSYGGAASVGGSGFLAVYLTGIVLGNTRLVFQRGILLFQDTLAWFGQVAMFVLLGLLCFPSRLLAVAWEGIGIALVLTLIARPIAVWLCLWPFAFSPRERVLVSWVGLRGAVPIILATYPLLFGLDDIGHLVFDVVFFAVLLSALAQGWSLSYVARRLGLTEPARAAPHPSSRRAKHRATAARACGRRTMETRSPGISRVEPRGGRMSSPRTTMAATASSGGDPASLAELGILLEEIQGQHLDALETLERNLCSGRSGSGQRPRRDPAPRRDGKRRRRRKP